MMKITNIVAGVRCPRALGASCTQHAVCHASSGRQLASTHGIKLKYVRRRRYADCNMTSLHGIGKLTWQTASCLVPRRPATDTDLAINVLLFLMGFCDTHAHERDCLMQKSHRTLCPCCKRLCQDRCRACHVPQAKETVKKLTEKLQNRDLETRPGRTMLETFEDEVNQALNKARDDSGKEAQRSLDASNNVVRMVSAGSKGSFINISQVCHLSTS